VKWAATFVMVTLCAVRSFTNFPIYQNIKKVMDSPKKQEAKGTWKQISGRIKEAWGSLTDDDISRFEGRKEQLVGHIQEKTGEKRSDISKKMDELWDDKS